MVTCIGLPFGQRADGRLVSIIDVPSGLECQCRCPACGCRLIAKKGDLIAHHFAHEADAECAQAYETMLHKLGKQIILDAGGVTVPPLVVRHLEREREIHPASWVPFDHVEKEVRWPGFQPDIMARRAARQLAVEIKVTHACGPEKIEIVRASGLAMMEIDLSHLPRLASEDQIRKAVLRMAPRRWLFNPRQAQHLTEFIVEVSEAIAREREQALFAAALKGMPARHAERTKAVLEHAKRPRSIHVTVPSFDPETIPDYGYMDIVVDGVLISSRYDKIAEVRLMEEVFLRLSTPRRWLIDTFWCDSKANSCYSVTTREGADYPELTMPLGREIHEQLMALSSGHNGIFVGETTIVDPDWGELDGL
jgi:hypothetical protein